MTGESQLLWAVIVGVVVLFGLMVLLTLCVIVLHLVRRERLQREARFKESWLPDVLDVLGGYYPVESLLTWVKPRHREAFLGLLLEYAVVVRGSEREQLVALAQPFLGSVVRHTRHWDPSVRALAIFTLGMLGTQTHHEYLRTALGDRSVLVAMTAAQALSGTKIPHHFDAVIGHLHRFERWGTSFLTSMLTTMGAGVAPRLVALLEDPAQPAWLRVTAAESLRWLNDLPSSESIVRLLQTEADTEVLAASLRLLRRVGGPEHATVVRPFCTSENPVLRIHAVSALAAIGTARDARLLIHAADDTSRWVAIRAVRGLQESGRLDVLRQMVASNHPRADLARQVLQEEGV